MGIRVLSEEEKEAILKAIESDKKFRYALMGLLGFSEILDRITRLEEGQQRIIERQQKIEEGFQRLSERIAGLEERQQKLEEGFQKILERIAILEERYQKLEERFAKLEERFVELEERVIKLEERVARVEEELVSVKKALEEHSRVLAFHSKKIEEMSRAFAIISYRWGLGSESVFRDSMKEILEKILGVSKVDRWIYYDAEGFVFGRPTVIEADIVVRDNVHMLIELKSSASEGDVLKLLRVGELYSRVTGVRPKLVLVAIAMRKKDIELAREMGIEVYAGPELLFE